MAFTTAYPAFLPTVAYFNNLLNVSHLLFLDHFQYQKRSPLTKSHNLANKLVLTVPVINNGYKKSLSSKKLLGNEPWRDKHLKSIKHLYHTFPYFDDYFPLLKECYNAKEETFTAFTNTFFKLFKNILKLNIKTEFSSALPALQLEELLVHYAHNINANKYLIAHLESKWINPAKIKKHGIILETYAPKQSDLLNTNIIHFIFEYGPEAPFLLRSI